MGLTEVGYVRRTYDDILNDKILRAKELFGEDIDTSDLTPLGKFIRINAYDQALAEEEIEAVYYSRFPNTASGQNLDRLLFLGNLTRNPATAASYTVEVVGAAGYVIPVGFLVGTDTELTYYSVSEAIIGEDGTCEIIVFCTEAGTVGNVTPGAISKVVNPDANVESVAGVDYVVLGTDEENDVDLRARLKLAIQGSGSCNENAIRAALLRVPTVQYATVLTNDEDTADSDGRPPHSFECYVLGGNGYEQEIAETIFDKKPIGIKTVGDKSVTITDASGNEKVVNFSAALHVSVTVRIALTTNKSFPYDGVAQIHKNVADHINSLGIGRSLVLSSIYGHIYGIAGVVEVTKLELSTDGGSSYSASNITVPKYGVAVCGNVTVEVTT